MQGLQQENDIIQFIFKKVVFATVYQTAWERRWIGGRSRSRGGPVRGQRSKRSHQNLSSGELGED